MTVDAVARVVDKIKNDKSEAITVVGIPNSLVDEIKQAKHSSDSEMSRAFASAYLNIHPNASWEQLTARLYTFSEFAAARESKSFMSTGKCVATSIIIQRLPICQ